MVNRKVLCLIVVLTLLLSVCPLSLASSAFTLKIDIDFIGNMLFSTYDVDLYLNDTELATLSHGVDYSGSFYAEEGSNTIFFYKHGDKKVKGSIELGLLGNTEVSCTISCSSDKISVSDVSIQTVENAAEEITDIDAQKEKDAVLLREFFLSVNEDMTKEEFKEKAEELGLFAGSYSYMGTEFIRAAAHKGTADIHNPDEGLGANADESYVEAHYDSSRGGKLYDYLIFDESRMIAGFVMFQKDNSRPSRFHGTGCYLIDYNKNEPGEMFGGYKVLYTEVDSAQAIVDYLPTVIRDKFDPLQELFILLCQGTLWDDLETQAKEWDLSCNGTSKYGYRIGYADNVTMPHIKEPGSVILNRDGRYYYYDAVAQQRENIHAEYDYDVNDGQCVYLVRDGERTKYDSAEQVLALMNAAR